VSFVYTNCVAACSGLTLHLREAVRVAREALGERGFSVLTVGFDPAHDTPERMLAYGRDRGVVDAGWRFASADAATVRRFTDETGFSWSPSTTRGFDHVAQVTVLDARGTVVHQVYGEAFEPPALVEPLKQVLLQGSVERVSVTGLIDRIRLYCSVYDPASGRYRFDFSMLAMGLPALFVLGMVAWGVLALGRRGR
jgi:protein SCO1/2